MENKRVGGTGVAVGVAIVLAGIGFILVGQDPDTIGLGSVISLIGVFIVGLAG